MSKEENDQSVGSMVGELLKKYNLEENTVSLQNKTTKNIETNKAIIRHIAKDFAMGKITEKDTHNSLLKKLNTTPDITQNIVNEIRTTLAPFIKNIEASRPKDDEEQIIASPQSFSPVNIEKSDITKKIQEIQTPKKNIQPKRKGLDSYREPIE